MSLGLTSFELYEAIRANTSALRGDKAPDGTVRCWWCGTEPYSLIAVPRSAQSGPQRYRAGEWPSAGDHQHAERPPTPGQIEQAGREALMRIIDAVR